RLRFCKTILRRHTFPKRTIGECHPMVLLRQRFSSNLDRLPQDFFAVFRLTRLGENQPANYQSGRVVVVMRAETFTVNLQGLGDLVERFSIPSLLIKRNGLIAEV